MTIGVVERLKAIDVDDDERQSTIFSEGPSPLSLQGFVKSTAIGNSG